MDIQNYNNLIPVSAVYTEKTVKIYKGNPYIEALPPMLDRSEVIKYLASFPEYEQEERELPTSERKLMLQSLVNYYYPTERTLEMYEKITALICTGYASRNPFSKQFNLKSKQVIRPKNYPYEIKSNRNNSSNNNGLAVVGISGIGKTSAIEQVLALYPQCIMHSEYKGMKCSFVQLVYIKLECPYDGSIKALCRQFFFELTMLFGENSYSYQIRKDMNTKEYLEKMKLVVHQLGLGMLIIDEIQNLREARGNERDQMLNFFVYLRNELSIPVVLIGTPKTYPVLQGDFRNTRRGIGQGGIEWGVLEKDNPYWKKLLKGMWRYQWTTFENILTEELEDTLFEESQGITDVLVKLYMMVQFRAIEKKDEVITKELIKKTAKKDFALIQPMLNAIRNNDLEALARFEDVRPPDMERIIQEHILKSSQKQEVVLHRRMLKELKKQEEKTFKELLFNSLTEKGYPKVKSRSVVSKVCNEIENYSDLQEGLDKAIVYLEIDKAAKKSALMKKDSHKASNVVSDDDLRNYDEYETLRKKGYIPDINKELEI